MKKEVIKVPQGKSPLTVLAEMGEETRNAWIFLHENVINKMKETADLKLLQEYNQKYIWDSKYGNPGRSVYFEKKVKVWTRVYEIESKDIAFKKEPEDPDYIIFLKME